MVIPTITPELAAQAPNPEVAWTLRPEKETEPLFTPDKKLNYRNYAIQIEYRTLMAKLGIAGHPVPADVKKKFERDMIEKYDPVTFAYLYMFEQIGANAC